VGRKKRKGQSPYDKKKVADRLHCTRRFMERFGIHYTGELRHLILRNIREQRGIFVKKLSNTRTVWKRVVPGHPDILVLYSSSTKEIVTVLDGKKQVLMY